MINRYLADNLDTPIDKLIELSQDEKWHIRYDIAQNPNTPIDILIKLSKDKIDSVRVSVCKNPNTPIKTLIELCKDENKMVFYWALLYRINRMALLK